MVCICARAASTTCSGHPSAAAAAAILSMTCLLFFSLVLSVSLRQVDIALRAAFTASRASFESPGTDTGLKLRGVTSTNLLCIVGFSSRFSTEIEDTRYLNTLIATTFSQLPISWLVSAKRVAARDFPDFKPVMNHGCVGPT